MTPVAWDDLSLAAMPDGLVIADGEGLVVHTNPRAERMLQIDGPGEPLTASLRLRDADGNNWCAVNQPYAGLSTRTGIPEQSWFLPDGEEILAVAGIHRAGPSAPIERVAVSLRSGRGRARLDRERADLVATVAHELRSPLTGVKGFVQAMLSRWDVLADDQKLLMLQTVSTDSERLSRLILELLDVARLDSGRLVLHPRPSDVEKLTRRVVDSVATGTPRPIQVVCELGLREVEIDPDKYVQVATNLVENAIRHGEGMVVVRLSMAADGWAWLLEVDDEGDGIPVDVRGRVTTKFWTYGTRAGSGLGLYLVNGIVRAHGGQVILTDNRTGGARVRVRWPVSPA